ncbi:MAG: molybdenum cofactor biosynthesis protein B [Gammaproteobacteria bacterium]|nr:molybdenum cofactor biosynthesis protein B [Gammaproteobacteria bacterium]
MPFVVLNATVLTVSDTRSVESDTSGNLLVQRLEQAGHRIAERKIQRDECAQIRALFERWIKDPIIDVIITTGGTGLTQRDVTPEAVHGLITKPIPGFGELFRMLSYDDIGTSTIQSRAEAGIADGTLIFLLPGSTGACELAMDKIIIQQLDATHRPCNLTELLPRIRHE